MTLLTPFRSSAIFTLRRIPNPSNRKVYTSHHRHLTTSTILPHLQAPSLLEARNPKHTSLIASHLQEQGILKVTLGFNDPQSTYLQHLIDSLHRHHGHKLPISHSASRGWFWDVRPANDNFQTENHQARSETMNEFPWHTDCSYENPTPRFFALQVLRHDHLGGGTLSVTSVASLTDILSESTRRALQKDEFQIHIPREFVKKAEQKSITGRILARSQGQSIMRFRQDILTPLTEDASAALTELNDTLKKVRSSNHAVHLTASDLPTGSVILVDNFRWLHARNHVKDPERHLRRVRWDAVPFGSDP
ncbi:taurine catabolism dioxygenase TauD [Pochonia chlamydosporia 170]|uniref:Taurine catabolism dioxygenase TauD n=1 Tax=Pochonia chlamydosporia 170 TaxID=1380566 RepID=A0A179FY40_METCM|nr:taurine catabolism dioxygenase TauD [Pochonia chlamydosporia 170]OAQ70100.1 taurine catabolism dioxygenase TauD [Pochonia chlamydosporia 170]